MENDIWKIMGLAPTAEELERRAKAEAEREEKNNFLGRYEWKNLDPSNYLLDMSVPLKKPEYLLSFHEAKFSMIKGLMTITGQAGQGKTATLALFISAILHPKGELGELKYCLRDTLLYPKIVYIDTEQEDYYTQLFYKRVCAKVGWNSEENNQRLKVYNLRLVTDPRKRWGYIIKIIDEEKPNVVIVDGLLDVVNNANDLEECTPRINECLAIASKYNLAFWGVIHQNPGNDTKMVGNIGSIAERKSGDIFRTKKQKEEAYTAYTIEQLKARGKDVDKMVFEIEYDNQHQIAIPKLKRVIEETLEEKEKREIIEKFGNLLKVRPIGYTSAELRKILNDGTHHNVKDNKDVKKAMQIGILGYDKRTKKFHYHGNMEQPKPKQTDICETNQMEENENTSQNENLPFAEPDGEVVPF